MSGGGKHFTIESKAKMLIGMELVQEVVETILLTGRVKNADPVSLLIVAEPEHGKTSVVLERPCASVFILSDVTGKGIQQLCQMMPEVTHFIINDMIAPSAKKNSVKQFTISMLCAMTEEGIRATAYPSSVEQFGDKGRRAIIACMPRTLVTDGRGWWNKSGFSSRMLPFAFTHSKDLTIRIKDCINGEYFESAWKSTGKEFKVPKMPINVELPKKMRDKIRRMSDLRSTILGEKGYRRLKQYRVIAAAHAIRRGWKSPVVTESDLDFLARMDEFVSYKECKPL